VSLSVAELIQQAPLAWLLSIDPSAPLAAPIPLTAVLDEAGELVELRGHLARRNPLVERFRTSGRALALFMGPQGYISPSWMADRTQAPTWNYACLQCVLDVELQDDAKITEADLRELVAQQEQGRDKAWSVDDMGPRYERLAQGIIGFRAAVVTHSARLKLGQDERDDVYKDIVAALAADPAAETLLAWMRAFNPGRD
jgi:transcriptional regulator